MSDAPRDPILQIGTRFFQHQTTSWQKESWWQDQEGYFHKCSSASPEKSFMKFKFGISFTQNTVTQQSHSIHDVSLFLYIIMKGYNQIS